MTEKQRAADQAAFERGMEDYRSGKSRDDSPYPPQSGYADFWVQGWEQEHEAHFG